MSVFFYLRTSQILEEISKRLYDLVLRGPLNTNPHSSIVQQVRRKDPIRFASTSIANVHDRGYHANLSPCCSAQSPPSLGPVYFKMRRKARGGG
jgi:hypothetical protein